MTVSILQPKTDTDKKGNFLALTDTFVKNVKHSGVSAGDKHAGGGGMYLLVKAGSKYWRMDYRFSEKRKTLALGTYPEVTLAKARQRRDKAREQLADGIDPSTAKREEKQATSAAAANTFKAVALALLDKTAAERIASTQGSMGRANTLPVEGVVACVTPARTRTWVTGPAVRPTSFANG